MFSFSCTVGLAFSCYHLILGFGGYPVIQTRAAKCGHNGLPQHLSWAKFLIKNNTPEILLTEH